MPDTSAVSERDARHTAVAIVLPTLFAAVLFVLIAVTVLLIPRLTRSGRAGKDEARKKRMLNLERACKAQDFKDWCSDHSAEHPEYRSEHPVCVICLEEMSDKAHVRGLGCLHVFHRECLDDWFSRWNEYCPLCHRPILPGMGGSRAKASAAGTEHEAAAMV